MGKHASITFHGRKHGFCIGCMRQFIGPGDRCPPCREKLRQRRKRKRR
jgi:hypothetical protein